MCRRLDYPEEPVQPWDDTALHSRWSTEQNGFSIRQKDRRVDDVGGIGSGEHDLLGITHIIIRHEQLVGHIIRIFGDIDQLGSICR